MRDLQKWVCRAHMKLGKGLLSRADLEASLTLNIALARELELVYLAIGDRNKEVREMGPERITLAMKKAGIQ